MFPTLYSGWRLHTYPRFALTFWTGFIFSRVIHGLYMYPRLQWFHAFPRYASVAYVPALCTDYMFSRAMRRLQMYPRFASVAYVPALCTGYMFSRAMLRLQMYPRVASVAYVPALCTGYMFSRAMRQLHLYPRFAPVSYFSAQCAGCRCTRALHRLLRARCHLLVSGIYVDFFSFSLIEKVARILLTNHSQGGVKQNGK